MAQTTAKRTYFQVWLALLVLLAATFAFARLNLGPFNTPVAMVIAFAKMVLIMLVFMHLRRSRRLVWVFAGAGFLWLLILIELTLSDYLTRGFSWSQ